MGMRLAGCGMRGLAILILNICSNYKKNPWLKASQSSRLPPEFARAVWLENTPSTSSIGGRKTELQAYWGWYILISAVRFLSHPWMYQGIFLLLLIIFQGTHGSSFSKRSLKYVKFFMNWRPWSRMPLGLRSRSWDLIMAGSMSVMSCCKYVPKVIFRSSIQFATIPSRTV